MPPTQTRTPYRSGAPAILDYYRRFIRQDTHDRCQVIGDGWSHGDAITKREAQQHITRELHRRINRGHPELTPTRRATEMDLELRRIRGPFVPGARTRRDEPRRYRPGNRRLRRWAGITWEDKARDWYHNYHPGQPRFLNRERTRFNLWHLDSEAARRAAA